MSADIRDTDVPPPSPNPAPSAPIGDRLRHQRAQVLGRGLREMAEILGVSPAHVTDLEKGYRVPSEELLLRIAKHYQLDEAVLRAGWARPDAVVHEVASQDSVTAAKVPEFLRTARTLSPEQWDQLIAQAKTLTGDSAKVGTSKAAANKGDASPRTKSTNPRGGAKGGAA